MEIEVTTNFTPTPDGSVDEYYYSTFFMVFFYLVGVAGSVVCLVGIVGNSLSIAVFLHEDLLTAGVNTYLLALALYDVIFLIARLLVVHGEWLASGLAHNGGVELRYTTPASAILEPISFVLETGSVFTTVAVTLDRCVSVTRPLQVKRMSGCRKVRYILTAVFVCSVILNIPLFMETNLQQRHDVAHNIIGWDRVETDYRYTVFHTTIYLLGIYPISKTLAPLLALFICNSIIAKTIFNTRKTEMTSSDQTSRLKDAHKVTAQVLSISVLTLLSRMSEALTFIFLQLNGTVFYEECPLYCYVVAALNEFMRTFHAGANFVYYCLFGHHFRSILIRRLGLAHRPSYFNGNHSTSTKHTGT